VNHIAVATADLDGYRAFYEEAIGLDTALVLASGPGHGRQAIVFAGDVMLHVFEVADRPARWGSPAPGTGSAMLERGFVDHLGFTVRDETALSALRRRLMDVGASSGDIRPLGWMLSVRYVDPDGFEGEVNCFNPRFDPSTLRHADEVIDPHWLERARRALRADGGHGDEHDQTTRGGGQP
jgi:catechol 2,3-dioxygenase-like lactoylglutathione lyase family enzyme